MSLYGQDVWYTPITVDGDNKFMRLVENPDGTPNVLTVTLTEGTYYLHDDSSLHSTDLGLLHAIADVLNNGSGSNGTLTGSPNNTYSWEVATPSSSDGATNAGIALRAAATAQDFKIDYQNGTPTTMDARWFGWREKTPSITDLESSADGNAEVYSSAYTARERLITFDLGDGSASDKTSFPNHLKKRSSERVEDANTVSWGIEEYRRFFYEDVWPAVVDKDRAADSGFADRAGLASGDLNTTWRLVWEALTRGKSVYVVHDDDGLTNFQIDAHNYEKLKLGPGDAEWKSFNRPGSQGGDLRTIFFECFIQAGTYQH